jgi:hypothetical protein
MDPRTTSFLPFCSLFFASHPIWGSLTIGFPVLGFVAAVLSVLIGRVRRGDPMSCKKFTFLSLVSLTSVFEAFFESGPQLVRTLHIDSGDQCYNHCSEPFFKNNFLPFLNNFLPFLNNFFAIFKITFCHFLKQLFCHFLVETLV